MPYSSRRAWPLLLAGSAAGLGVALASGVGVRLAAALTVGGLSGLLLRRAASTSPDGGDQASFAIVPWGVLVEAHDGLRALMWSSVRSIRVRMAHTRDGGNTDTLASFVTVETGRETFHGRTAGAAPLDRLEAYHTAYADEQSTPLAFDLEGTTAGDVTEPEWERLVGAARAWLDTAEAHRRLGLHGAGYRRASARVATRPAVEVLRAALRGAPRAEADPRAFAAVLAAELGATELVRELLELVQSPHPLLAAIAKQAALGLGAPTSRAGSIDEVAPFLHPEDDRALRTWVSAGP
ncbi:MAG: hypothetical protein IPF92_26460 [Myxococcales bacterium]|nr:hypothetical protein [Myxococcales bacterium]MBL0194194.1 hypothetical protein [Myxococcales bacterium]